MNSGSDFVYDIESYRNMFSAGIVHEDTGTRWIFEVSDRINQAPHFIEFLWWLNDIDARMFGFNNEGYDWPVCQHLMNVGAEFTSYDAYYKSQAIIEGRNRWEHNIWPSDRLVTQGDLYKIHHFDNMNRSTSLKKLEVNMRSADVRDLPYSPHSDLTDAQKDETIEYMCYDVAQTLKFKRFSADQIAFRDDLAVKYPNLGDVLNFNDTKIGKKYFEYEIERRHPGSCRQRVNGRREQRQTIRSEVRLADCISPKVSFDRPEFQRVLDWLRDQVLQGKQIEDSIRPTTGEVETKGVFKGLSASIEGFKFVFGTGGIHGSVKNRIVRESDTHLLIDVDVASYYPNLAIANGWFPEHLGSDFCDVYLDVYNMRKGHAKNTAENAMLKLALNGVYGDSNSKFSVFFDPQYTMSITINGQLYLCMLAEWLMSAIPGGQMVQINTDGLTMLVPRTHECYFDQTCREWEGHTGLDLERADYRAMYVRDVNSYIAEKTDGKLKRIGAYAHETTLENPFTRERLWHKNHSALVVPKAAEAAMVRGVDVAEFIMNHQDPFDFMLSVKVPRSSRLMWGDDHVQNICRYWISTSGKPLKKFMPPLKGKENEREFAVEKGWNVGLCNHVRDFDPSSINWLYYIEEARKLVIS